MSAWPSNPDWIDPININAGNEFNPADGVICDDINAIVNDLIYLYTHGGGGGGSNVSANVPLQGNEPTLKSLRIDNQSYAIDGILYSSVAPTSANTDGTIKIAILNSEPANKYDGWIYIIISTYNITTDVTNGSVTGSSTIREGSTASVTITPAAGYQLPSSVTVTGADSVYDSTTGVITLSNPTGNVSITAVCSVQTFSITTNVTNGTASGATSITYGGTAQVTITPDSGYSLPESIFAFCPEICLNLSGYYG